ncbi:MAG: hypothetical protein ACLT4C_03135 [Butyricicoccus sp.]
MDTTDKQKKKPPQKPKAVNTAWVGLITVISFALSVVMSYISNEALASAVRFCLCGAALHCARHCLT